MPLTPGTRLGPYEILAPLGAGGMGEVYRARDPKLGREVAINVLPAESLHDGTARPLIPPQLWMYSVAASPDGKRIAYTSNTGQGNIWMLEDF